MPTCIHDLDAYLVAVDKHTGKVRMPCLDVIPRDIHECTTQNAALQSRQQSAYTETLSADLKQPRAAEEELADISNRMAV